MKRASVVLIVLFCLTAPGIRAAGQEPSASGNRTFGILVVSSTPGYRHKSIPAGNEALRQIGKQIEQEASVKSVRVDIIDSEGTYADTDPVTFPTDPSALEPYDVIVFNNSNDANAPDDRSTLVLNDEQAGAFESFIRSGGGYVGIHSALDNQTADSFMTRVRGAYYGAHGRFQDATIHVTDRVHPSTESLPVEWKIPFEWYTYSPNVRGKAQVLALADKKSYNGNFKQDQIDDAGHHYPISWCRRVAGGRSWFTAIGHSPEHFKNDDYLNHLRGGITWAGGLRDGEAAATVWSSFRKQPVVTKTGSPSMIEPLPDGRLLYVDRRDYNNDDADAIMIADPDAGTNAVKTVLELRVSDERLNGLKSIKLDPEFSENKWVYVFYAPPDDAVEEDINYLSRFTMEGNAIDRSSEVRILSVPILRDIQGHIAGDMAWGPDGEQLYLSLGDNTDCCATGYAPIDEREGREAYDAQRTSSNTADLRGSILRIIPREDGTYDVPDDNLFTRTDKYKKKIKKGLVRPEIFAMGMRNPYRITFDPKTGALFWGDYGPDAGQWNKTFGPPGVVEYNRTTEPGFFGWPYFVGMNVPYRNVDFETTESGSLYNPDNPTNDSPNNTGLKNLPAARKAMITSPSSWTAFLEVPNTWSKYVPYKTKKQVPFPQVSGGSPMQGPMYRHRDTFGTDALPRYYDGKLFIMERGRNWIKYVTLNQRGEPVAVEPFMPGTLFKRPMDMEVGPNGALYVAEWGSGYEGPNKDSGIYKIQQRNVQVSFPDLAGSTLPLNSGSSKTLSVRIHNLRSTKLKNVTLRLEHEAENALQWTPAEPIRIDQIGSGKTLTARWKISAPPEPRTLPPLKLFLQYERVNSGPRKQSRNVSITFPEQASPPFALNAGGDQPVTFQSFPYEPTPHPAVKVSGNSEASSNNKSVAIDVSNVPVSNTEQDQLYQTLQYGGDLTYEVQIPNGTYDVTLHFVENYFDEPGKRVFDIIVEGNTVLKKLDVYGEAGKNAALTKTFRGVQVNDGKLTISTNTRKDNSMLCGFRIQPGQTSTGNTGPSASEADQKIVIKGTDQMTYDRTRFSVKPGDTVRLVFKHVGKLPVQSMGHNVVILKNPELDPVKFARRALENGGNLKNDYLPKSVRDRVLARTELIGGGKTDSIVFTAPEDPGDYPYLCSFPNHATSMKGVMNVQKSDDGQTSK